MPRKFRLESLMSARNVCFYRFGVGKFAPLDARLSTFKMDTSWLLAMLLTLHGLRVTIPYGPTLGGRYVCRASSRSSGFAVWGVRLGPAAARVAARRRAAAAGTAGVRGTRAAGFAAPG